MQHAITIKILHQHEKTSCTLLCKKQQFLYTVLSNSFTLKFSKNDLQERLFASERVECSSCDHDVQRQLYACSPIGNSELYSDIKLTI